MKKIRFSLEYPTFQSELLDVLQKQHDHIKELTETLNRLIPNTRPLENFPTTRDLEDIQLEKKLAHKA